MDSRNNINTEKVPLSSENFLSLQSRLQDYVKEVLQQPMIDSPEERVLIESELDQVSYICYLTDKCCRLFSNLVVDNKRFQRSARESGFYRH